VHYVYNTNDKLDSGDIILNVCLTFFS